MVRKSHGRLQENNAGSSRVKTFILENRELYRLLLAKLLGEKNGHEVVFFASPAELENNHDPRDFEMMATHLLPGRLHFKNNGTVCGHAVYGETLDSATILWCRKSGVKGILDLQDGEEEWAGCLRALGNGETAETSSVSKALNEGHGKRMAKLSRREAEVARMLVKGFSAKQVAASLGTSEGTVKNQRKAVFRKLGIVRATQLAGAMGFKAR